MVTVPSSAVKEKVPLVPANTEAKEMPTSSGNAASEGVTGEEKPECATQPLVTSTTEDKSDATLQGSV